MEHGRLATDLKNGDSAIPTRGNGCWALRTDTLR